MTERIGPGRLVLVVGPSGAGKDTLIDAARAAFGADPTVVFPRRVVTRPSSTSEDHDTVSEADFDAAAANGGFAIWWSAHGLKYGIPSAADAELRAGRTIVCNVSRTVIAEARKRYANVSVVLVTAPADVLAARLQTRGRQTDGSVTERIGRSAALSGEVEPDFVIENIGSVEAASRIFLRAISGSHAMLGL